MWDHSNSPSSPGSSASRYSKGKEEGCIIFIVSGLKTCPGVARWFYPSKSNLLSMVVSPHKGLSIYTLLGLRRNKQTQRMPSSHRTSLKSSKIYLSVPIQGCKEVTSVNQRQESGEIEDYINRWKIYLFLNRKNQCCQNAYTTWRTLQIQHNPYQSTNGIFHRTTTKKF